MKIKEQNTERILLVPTLRERLRGCIGHLDDGEPIVKPTSDGRFYVLSKAEFVEELR